MCAFSDIAQYIAMFYVFSEHFNITSNMNRKLYDDKSIKNKEYPTCSIRLVDHWLNYSPPGVNKPNERK